MSGFPPAHRTLVLISVNPRAGAGSADQRVDRLVAELGRRGLEVEVLSDLDQLARRVASSHEQNILRALVGVGGDGTVAELINRTGPGVPITMLAAGTSNLLPKYLGMGRSPEEVARTIFEGVAVLVDAGRANGRLFSLMIGCGLDAEVVRRVHAHRVGHIGFHSYVRPILASLRDYPYPEMQIHWDDPEELSATGPAARARWFFGFNLPCYAGWLPLGPAARGDDGLLDATVFRRGSLPSSLGYLAATVCRAQRRLPGCTMRRFRRVRITASEEVPYQLDGDPGGRLPVDVEVVPRRLTFLVPAATAVRLGLTGLEIAD